MEGLGQVVPDCWYFSPAIIFRVLEPHWQSTSPSFRIKDANTFEMGFILFECVE